jgi:hypothetical protein
MDAPLWLNVQQHLYRDWGEVFGPIEILALLTTLTLLGLRWHDRRTRPAYFIATVCYVAMLADFFIFNQPVNEAVNKWTINTLPANWFAYRIQWKVGHALTALFSIIAFVVPIRQRTIVEE